MNTCKYCQASIPTGRNFCTAHYMQALGDYESAMVEYHNKVAIWNSLSAGDQAAVHANAEQSAVGGYAGVVGFIIGALIWYTKFPDVDALIGICILVACVVAFTMIKPIRVLAGQMARLFVHAIGYFIAVWIVGAIVSIWSLFLQENAVVLSVGLALAVLVISAVLEFSGKHHASGAPGMPSKPNP